jgi:small redox-active disulfide protein 2
MNIKILGSGCTNCKNLEANTRRALEDLGLEAEIDHVLDAVEIVSWGVMSTPALVVDDTVVVSGRVPSSEQIEELITANAD